MAAEPQLLLSFPPAHRYSVRDLWSGDSSQLLCPLGTPDGTVVRKRQKLNETGVGGGRPKAHFTGWC